MIQTKKSNQNSSAVSSVRRMSKLAKKGKWRQALSFLPFGLSAPKPVVSVLRLEGVIGKMGKMQSGLNLSSLNKLIERAFEFKNLKAVCLIINSPGGSPVQSELISRRITDLATEKNVPVYSFVEDMAASGGYWLACTGREIYVSRSSIVGSIGVISASFGFQDAIKKLGVERRVYTQGKNKSVLDPFKPAKSEDIKLIEKIQKEIHTHFIDTVKARRGGKLTQSGDLLFSGEFWTGQIAVDYGLADGIDNMHSFIHDKYGDNVKIEYVEDKKSWFKQKLGLAKANENFANEIAEGVLDAVEERLVSSKFGFK